MSENFAPRVSSIRSRPPVSPRSEGLPSASVSGVREAAAVGLPEYVSTVDRAVSTQLLLRPGSLGSVPLMFCVHDPSLGSGWRTGSPLSSRGTTDSRLFWSSGRGPSTPPGWSYGRESEAGRGGPCGVPPGWFCWGWPPVFCAGMLAWRWTGGGTVCWLCGFCALGGFDGVDGDCWAGVCADGVCGDGVCGVGVVPDVGGALGGVFRPGAPLGFAGVVVLVLAPELEPVLGVGVVLGVEAGFAAGELLGVGLGLVLGVAVGVVTGVVARFGVLDVLGVVFPLGFVPVTGVLAGVRVRVGVEDDDGEGVLGFALGLVPGVELGVLCGVVLPVGVPVPAVGFGLVGVAALVVVVGVAAGEVSRCGVLVVVLGPALGPALGLVPGVVVGVALGIVLRLGVPVPVPVPVLGPVTGLLAGAEVRGGVEGDDDGEGVPAADTFGVLSGEPPAGVAVGVLGPVVAGREEGAGPALSRLGPEGMPEAGDAAAWVPGSGLWWLGV
jgi:hypothetical protein